jgi:hypothetical protein
MTVSIMILSKVTLSIMTLNIMTLSIIKLSIMTLSIAIDYTTLMSVMLCVDLQSGTIMLSVVNAECHFCQVSWHLSTKATYNEFSFFIMNSY